MLDSGFRTVVDGLAKFGGDNKWRFVGYRLNNRLTGEFHALFAIRRLEQAHDHHVTEQLASQTGQKAEEARFALLHWPK